MKPIIDNNNKSSVSDSIYNTSNKYKKLQGEIKKYISIQNLKTNTTKEKKDQILKIEGNIDNIGTAKINQKINNDEEQIIKVAELIDKITEFSTANNIINLVNGDMQSSINNIKLSIFVDKQKKYNTQQQINSDQQQTDNIENLINDIRKIMINIPGYYFYAFYDENNKIGHKDKKTINKYVDNLKTRIFRLLYTNIKSVD